MSFTLRSLPLAPGRPFLPTALHSSPLPWLSDPPPPQQWRPLTPGLPAPAEPVPTGRRWFSQHPPAHRPPAALPAAPHQEEWYRPEQGCAQGEPAAGAGATGLGSQKILISRAFQVPSNTYTYVGLPGGTSWEEPTCQFRRCEQYRFNPWVGKIPW